jgi:hypothetical protein
VVVDDDAAVETMRERLVAHVLDLLAEDATVDRSVGLDADEATDTDADGGEEGEVAE